MRRIASGLVQRTIQSLPGLLVGALATALQLAAPARADTPEPFGFTRAVPDLSRAQASICAQFTRPLDARPETHYADWIKLAPPADAHYRVQGNAVCIDGVSLGRRYKLSLLAGLPAQDGSKLAQAAEANVDFGDRPKLVQFAGQGFILTRDAPAGVGLDTVNVDKVAVEVLRINDRLAPRMLRDLRGDQSRYAYYLQDLAENTARSIWSGIMETPGQHNEVVHTAFPLSQVVAPRQPGLYLVVAANTQGLQPRSADKPYLFQRSEESEFAAQLVVQTDIALTSVTAADGLHVFARSLASAAPLPGVRLELQARDSQPLGTGTTDALGQVVFAPGLLRGAGAATANAVVAWGADQDFTLLDLQQPAFDLSDRGVTGRETPGPLDVFVYTDRGIYRPGERIHASALLRDRLGRAVEDGGLTLTLRKPNGVAYKALNLPPQPAGGFTSDFDVPDTASRGIWRLEATDADAKVIGQAELEVQDFVPQRLKVTARSAATALHPNDMIEVALDGRFLYGAPAAGLEVEGHVNVAPDPAPFPQSAQGFRFGMPRQEFKPLEFDLDADASDADGHAAVHGKLELAAPANLPLKASITVGMVEPGGRVTNDTLDLPIRTGKLMLGIRPRFTDAHVRDGDTAEFELIAVDAEGKPQAVPLHWTLVEEVHHYDWFLTKGTWNFHRSDTDKAVASGDVTTLAERPSLVSQPTDWGDYRLVVEGPAGSMASYGFHAGWMETSGAAETPDKVEVTVEHARYATGETARLRIVPPYAGKVRLMLARDKVFDVRELDVPREGTTVEVPVGADWGSGAYALASLYRPADGGRGHMPVRAIGLAWIGIDPGTQLLNVALTLPEKVTPRQRIALPVKIAGGVPGEQVFLTLSAVDEGILQLTRFRSPDPAAWYFGQRRLAVDIRDDYGKLLDGTLGNPGVLRSGGDAFAGRGLPVVPTRSVALFSGLVAVSADGTASVPVEIPDFEGELRLMAVAFSHSGVGAASAPLTVRDPVVPDVALPRFLAPGDEAEMTVLVDNRDGGAGAYSLETRVEGAASLPETQAWQFSLEHGQRRDHAIRISGRSEGTATITTVLHGPQGLAITRSWQIAVRGAHYPITLESVALQKRGEAFTLDQHVLDAFVPGSVSAQLSYSRLAGIDVAGLLQSLWRYPYGCTEQLASTAFPLVYYDDPALSTGAADKSEIRARVQNAVDRIIDRQNPDGSFGLWRAGDDLASAWLNLYALDFLVHARAAGFAVPDDTLERGYGNAQSAFRGDGTENGAADARAYAAWLLAPTNRVDLGALRQLHDKLQARATMVAWTQQPGSEADPLALGQLSGALAVLGDKSRGASALRFAVAGIERPFVAKWWEPLNYWSRLRDAAALLAVGAESDQLAALRPLIPRLQALSRTPERLSTQEKAWLLVAAHAVTAGDAAAALTVNGSAISAPHGQAALAPSPAAIAAGYSVTPANADLYRSLVIHGAPRIAPSAMASGLHLTKSYRGMNGDALDAARLPQNRRFIVVLEGNADDTATHRVALVDMLPAGWEIEAVLRPDQAPDFLGELTTLRLREGRDDRMVAAFDLGEASYAYFAGDEDSDGDDKKPHDAAAKKGAFRVAYVVRAVTQGSFTLPEAVAEDMYRPGVMARTAAGSASVLAP